MDELYEISEDTRKAVRLREIRRMSNRQLLEEALQANAGDDWDGNFSKFGQWELYELEDELSFRLGFWLKEKRIGSKRINA